MTCRKYLKYCLALVFVLVLYRADAHGHISHLISVQQFNDLVENDTNVVIIDIRKPEEYKKGHYINALNIWRSDYTDTTFQYGGMMPTREHFKQILSSLGVNKTNYILLYDGRGGCEATRFWWILKTYGHQDAYVIDGGFDVLSNNVANITNQPTILTATNYDFPNNEDRSLCASLADVKLALDDASTIILDTRAIDEFIGKRLKKGAYQSGRIPGSVHNDWGNSIDFNNNKFVKSIKDLEYDFNKLGITKDKNIIVYCQSGVRSSHTTFILSEILLYPNVKNYDGSWIEWSFNKDLPIDSGVIYQEESIATVSSNYWALFVGSFGGYANYVWSEITFQTRPWYQNYFWWLIVLSIVVWFLEILFPWRKNQPIVRTDFWIDAFYMFFNFFIFNLVIFIAFCNLTAQFFSDLFGGDLASLALINIKSYPEWAQLLVFFVATDFIQWFTHVMLHRFSFLWKFHKVHHSVEEMGFAAHLRYHWMENVFYKPMKYIMVMLIGGFHPEQAFIVYYVAIAIGHLNHANIGWSYGPLKYIVNNPKMHIWHHSYDMLEEKPYGSNFGISLSIWDYIFRTNHIPYSGKDIRLGFNEIEKFPKSFFNQLIVGFQNKKG